MQKRIMITVEYLSVSLSKKTIGGSISNSRLQRVEFEHSGFQQHLKYDRGNNNTKLACLANAPLNPSIHFMKNESIQSQKGYFSEKLEWTILVCVSSILSNRQNAREDKDQREVFWYFHCRYHKNGIQKHWKCPFRVQFSYLTG